MENRTDKLFTGELSELFDWVLENEPEAAMPIQGHSITKEEGSERVSLLLCRCGVVGGAPTSAVDTMQIKCRACNATWEIIKIDDGRAVVVFVGEDYTNRMPSEGLATEEAWSTK